MSDNAIAGLTGIVLSVLLQIFKDQVNINHSTLRWVAAILGALAGGSAGFLGGGDSVGAIVTNTGLSGLIVAGTHSLLLQNSFLGQILKAIGAAVIKGPGTTPTAP